VAVAISIIRGMLRYRNWVC